MTWGARDWASVLLLLEGTVAYLEAVNSALVYFTAGVFILSVMAFRQ